jgi:hypothetical protein
MRITEDFFGDIDRVVYGAFAIDDRVMAVYTVSHEGGVGGAPKLLNS